MALSEANRRQSRVGLVAALVLLAGCGEPTGPSPPTLRFFALVAFGSPSVVTMAEARPQSIVVTGGVLTTIVFDGDVAVP